MIFNSENCYTCAEYQDNLKPTKLCDICKCQDCEEGRHLCYRNRFCRKFNVPIEFN
jgi:hypothetical protein